MCPSPDGPPHEMVDSTPISSEQGALIASATMANKRKRGRNLCTKFKKLRENGLILITIPPGAKGPVGKNASVFTRRVGFVVCEHVNLSYESWSKAPEEHRQTLKNRLVEYLKFIKEEVRANVSPDLTQDNWDALCDLYETDKWKGKSKRNKENRGKNKIGHTCGSKSFIAYYEEIGKVDFYKMTRTKKDGSFATTFNEEKNLINIPNLMKEKVADEENQSTEEEIFTEVLGTRRGFVRGMGKFVIPTPTPSSHSRYEPSMNIELENYKQELSNALLK
ncbi:hypothetical protein SO802_022026 [Lithocarpus litseifolius]|uniref:Uncharacterized protein n=1 Tax=Lithocarpus litseifolius TaxID=425828 RepID=A0AAW2CGM2_9ROSI